jgi:mercuric ion transport protein
MNPLTPKSITGYVWTGLAVLVCPCHLPLIIGALAGTGVGAILSKHWVLGLGALIALFWVSTIQAWRRLCKSPCETSCDLG